jgi:hypothetical protein
MILKHKNLYKIKLKVTDPTPPIDVEEADLSISGANCGDPLPNVVYVDTQVDGTITDGDTVYSDPETTTFFPGGGFKYLISLDGGINVHSVTISNEGEITYIELCEEERIIEPALISRASTPEADCITPLVENVFIELQNPAFISSEDRIFTDSLGTINFPGDGDYWRIKLLSDVNNGVSAIVNGGGFISNITVCT